MWMLPFIDTMIYYDQGNLQDERFTGVQVPERDSVEAGETWQQMARAGS